jgi:hypothetical protein
MSHSHAHGVRRELQATTPRLTASARIHSAVAGIDQDDGSPERLLTAGACGAAWLDSHCELITHEPYAPRTGGQDGRC